MLDARRARPGHWQSRPVARRCYHRIYRPFSSRLEGIEALTMSDCLSELRKSSNRISVLEVNRIAKYDDPSGNDDHGMLVRVFSRFRSRNECSSSVSLTTDALDDLAALGSSLQALSLGDVIMSGPCDVTFSHLNYLCVFVEWLDDPGYYFMLAPPPPARAAREP